MSWPPQDADRKTKSLVRVKILQPIARRSGSGYTFAPPAESGRPAEGEETVNNPAHMSKMPALPTQDRGSAATPYLLVGEEVRCKASPRTEAAPATGVRLLVIEDDPDQRELIGETLEDFFGVGCVTTVETCAAARATAVDAFDLILCDYNLPDGNGLDLLAEIAARSDVPVMMLTGENASDTAKEAIRRGATDYVVKAGQYLTTIPLTVEKNIAAGRMHRERKTAEASLQQKHTELQVRLRQMEQLASTDPMTGCYNRRAFEQIFQQLFAEAYRTGADLSCVMIDLDQFKQVNDTFGHAIGDEVVKTAARSIRANLRQMDVACRYGGDEFIVLLPKADSAQASAVAERIRHDYALGSGVLLKGVERTMSIGVGSLREVRPVPASPESLMVATDRALYQAKTAGRDKICSAA